MKFSGNLFYTIVLIVILFWTGCKEANVALPLSEAELVAVLTDAHIAEAAMQALPNAKKDSMSNIYYDQIFKIHGIEEKDFRTSLELISQQPLKMEEIYSKVLEELDRKKASIGPNLPTVGE